MRRLAFFAPLAAVLAVAAGPAAADPASINVTLGSDLQEKAGELGEREVARQADRLAEVVRRALARGEAGEAAQAVSVAELLAVAGDDARRAGAEVEVDAPADLTATLRPLAFKRALTNLAGNAAVHGEHVRLSARPLPSGGLEVAVEDDGPGIPDDMHEEAFRPFSRLDASRNQNRKGVGLGLAIARDVARGHGGDITLARSDLGGLKALIRLPG